MAKAETDRLSSGETTPNDPFEPTVGLLGIARILFRWSFVVAPLAALTIWIALSQTGGIEPEYTAEASLILIGPSELLYENPDTGEISVENLNPYQQLGGTLPTLAQVTVLALSDATIGEELLAAQLTDNYEVGVDIRAPILIVRAYDSDVTVALATVDRLTDLAVDDLKNRQDEVNAPDNNRIGLKLISSGARGGPDFSARDRMRLAIAAVGFAISAASAFFLDGLAELWRRRRRRREQRAFYLEHRALSSAEAGAAGSAADLETRFGRQLVETLHLATGDLTVSRAATDETLAAARDAFPLSDPPALWLYREALDRATTKAPSRDKPALSTQNPLWSTVANMAGPTRNILALSYLGGLSDAQISQVLDLTTDVVATRRAMAEVRIQSTQNQQESETDPADEPAADDEPRDHALTNDALSNDALSNDALSNDEGAPDDAAPDDEPAPDEAPSNDAQSNDEAAPDEGVPNDAPSNDAAPDDALSNDEAAPDEAVPNDAPSNDEATPGEPPKATAAHRRSQSSTTNKKTSSKTRAKKSKSANRSMATTKNTGAKPTKTSTDTATDAKEADALEEADGAEVVGAGDSADLELDGNGGSAEPKSGSQSKNVRLGR